MTDFYYIKFKDITSAKADRKKNNLADRIVKTLLFFIPEANPEYNELIEDVAEWQIEIDPSNNLPTREIGKDFNDEVILIMPYRDNYGYWTDNNITLDYFKNHFEATNLDKEEFDRNWDAFSKNNPEKPK